MIRYLLSGLFSLCFFLYQNSVLCQSEQSVFKLHYVISNLDFNEKSNFKLMYDNTPISFCNDNTYRALITLSNGHILVDIWSFGGVTNCKGLSSDLPIKNHTIEIVDDRNTMAETTWVLKLPVRAWSFGINAIPLRIRPAITQSNPQIPSTATTNFGLAVTYGYTWGHGSITTRGIATWTQTIACFIGPNSVGTPYTGLPTGQNNFALSSGFAYIFARNSVGVLLLVGIDNAFGNKAESWDYQRRPWVGIGVSTSILK